MAYPIPLLEKRLSPRKSHSKTQPRLSRTFSDIFPWQDFRERSRELFNGLDDTEHIYPKTVSRILPRGSVLSAADECEVRGRVVIMLDSVNDIAQRLNIPVQCTGGGSGRSMCFTDLVVRPTGAQSNPANLSSQILGTGEVKGDWQFQLKRGERLEDALHDPKRIGNIVQTIQQVGANERSLVSCCIMLLCTMCHHIGMMVSGQASPACVTRSWLVVQSMAFVSRPSQAKHL